MLARCVLAALLPLAYASAQTLAGQIVEDHTGAPLPSVNILVAHPGDRFLAADLETDREGRFQAVLPPGEYRLEIVRPGYAGTNLRVTLVASGTTIAARMIKHGIISGRVYDQRNQPVTGATVYALPKPAGSQPVRPPGGYTMSAATNSRGEYRIHDLPPGEYYAVVSLGASTRAMGTSGRPSTAEGLGSQFVFYPTNTRPDVLAFAGGEDRRNIDFNILTGALFRISGKVEPKPEDTYFIIGLIDPNQPTLAVAVAESAADGTFSFSGIPAGSYRLVAASSARARNGLGFLLASQPVFGSARVSVSAMDLENVVVNPDAARTATFALKTSASCPTAVKLDLVPLEEWGSRLNRTIDLTVGQPAAISGLAPARYALTPSTTASACYLNSESMLDLSNGSPSATVDVQFAPAAEVRGRLDTNGRATGGFSVALAPAEDAKSIEIAVPDAQGRFSFAGLRPGRYRMAAFVSGQRIPDVTKMFEFEVRGGSNAEIDLIAPVPEVAR